MVVGPRSPDIAVSEDQRSLRTPLKRSEYPISDLEPQVGPDRAPEHLIKDGMTMADDYPVSKRQAVVAERAALSRWEDEGGSPSVSGTAQSQVPGGSNDDKGK